MNTFKYASLAGLALTIGIAATGTSLPAQALSPLGDQLAASWLRGPQDAWSRALRRQPAVDAALRDFGYRPDRLTPQQDRALGEGFAALFPERDPRHYRLNRSQGTALVYLALVHQGGRGYAGYPARSACERVERRIQALEDGLTMPGRSQPRHLARDEQRFVQEEARQIQQLARSCGDHQLAREAQELVDLAERRQVERELVHRQLRRMRSLARFAAA